MLEPRPDIDIAVEREPYFNKFTVSKLCDSNVLTFDFGYRGPPFAGSFSSFTDMHSRRASRVLTPMTLPEAYLDAFVSDRKLWA